MKLNPYICHFEGQCEAAFKGRRSIRHPWEINCEESQ
jgi:hypothetical protein